MGKAHTLADIVVWSNNKNKEPIGTLSLDLTGDIRKTLHKKVHSTSAHGSPSGIPQWPTRFGYDLHNITRVETYLYCIIWKLHT